VSHLMANKEGQKPTSDKIHKLGFQGGESWSLLFIYAKARKDQGGKCQKKKAEKKPILVGTCKGLDIKRNDKKEEGTGFSWLGKGREGGH